MDVCSETLAVVLAGGIGSRLAPLTRRRAKPAVPFAGAFRIVDFTLLNCLQSGLSRILVLTQYQADSVHRHLRRNWAPWTGRPDGTITPVSPNSLPGTSSYRGTADAVYQNLDAILRSGARWVLILSGDHIYRMDYSGMIRAHQQSDAVATVACTDVPLAAARRFGVVTADTAGRVVDFHEKPNQPQAISGHPRRALVSMGIYVFSTEGLIRILNNDHGSSFSGHDFGQDIFPSLIRTQPVYAWHAGSGSNQKTPFYWRDVGTIDAYHRASMDMLKPDSLLDLTCSAWTVCGYAPTGCPDRSDDASSERAGSVQQSLLCPRVVTDGAAVTRSILSADVTVEPGAAVTNSIVFDGATIGAGACIRNCIVEEAVDIPPGMRIGTPGDRPPPGCTVSETGITVVTPECRFPEPWQIDTVAPMVSAVS